MIVNARVQFAPLLLGLEVITKPRAIVVTSSWRIVKTSSATTVSTSSSMVSKSVSLESMTLSSALVRWILLWCGLSLIPFMQEVFIQNLFGNLLSDLMLFQARYLCFELF